MRDFKLSQNFISSYVGLQPKWGYNGLGYVVYKRTYSRVKPDGSTEEFWETCQRVVEGVYSIQKQHCRNLRLPWNNEKAQKSAQEMFRRLWAFKWLPPGRGLWMMGTDYIDRAGAAALNNCFSGSTEILTLTKDNTTQVVQLQDVVGQDILVFPTNTTNAVPAVVSSFGEQALYNVVFKPKGLRSNFKLSFEVTKNHRWLLADGTSTTDLKVGDEVVISPTDTQVTDSLETARGYAHGLIFGDGTRHTYYPDTHFIRLCGAKEQHNVVKLEALPEHLSTTYPPTFGGDAVVTLKLAGENWKALPSNSSIEYLKGFLEGWMSADSHENSSGSYTLDSVNNEELSYITKWAPVLGYTVTGWSTDTTDTNYGPRNLPLHRVTLVKSSTVYKVVSFSFLRKDTVYCPVVPDHNQFALAGGLITGNCGFVSTQKINLSAQEFADPFCWAMDMLMLGVGVGFDTKGADTVVVQKPKRGSDTFVVEDSREGWVSLLRRFLAAYYGLGSIPERIDYSLVRVEGSPIKGFGGTASGFEPLHDMILSIEGILDALVGKKITSSAIADIFNLIGRCVVAGNVRRSAEIAFGDPSDSEFLNLKNPEVNGEALMHHRWASNNSVFATVGMDYSLVADMTAKNGEPGYMWLDTARAYGRMKDGVTNIDARAMGGNPCLEQTLEDRELCCLVETLIANHDSYEDYQETLKYAYLYAKSVTLMATHDERTNAVMMRNRRIGCSMTGIVQAMSKFGRRNFFNMCDKSYGYLKNLDAVYSSWLCIPTSIKMTSVKPSGTISLLAGATPGIHYPHSEYYIRRVRFQSNHPMVSALKLCGYHIEQDAYSPNTSVVAFPTHEEYYSRGKEDVTIWEQLENAAQMQYYWADNQVSVTVTFKPEEAHQIKEALELYDTRLKGVSFLPTRDHGYVQAPYEEIDQQTYEDMVKGIDFENLPGMLEMTNQLHDQSDRFCDGEACEIK